MESTKLAELLAAQYNLNRTVLQIHQALIDYQFASMTLQIAVEATRLAEICWQQEQINLAIESRKLSTARDE